MKFRLKVTNATGLRRLLNAIDLVERVAGRGTAAAFIRRLEQMDVKERRAFQAAILQLAYALEPLRRAPLEVEAEVTPGDTCPPPGPPAPAAPAP